MDDCEYYYLLLVVVLCFARDERESILFQIRLEGTTERVGDREDYTSLLPTHMTRLVLVVYPAVP